MIQIRFELDNGKTIFNCFVFVFNKLLFESVVLRPGSVLISMNLLFTILCSPTFKEKCANQRSNDVVPWGFEKVMKSLHIWIFRINYIVMRRITKWDLNREDKQCVFLYWQWNLLCRINFVPCSCHFSDDSKNISEKYANHMESHFKLYLRTLQYRLASW